MSDLNITTISGRLVRNPEMRIAATGTPVSSFCVATNRRQAQEPKQREERAFVPCVAFGWTAETVAKKQKGEHLLAVGRLRTDSWVQNGATHTRLILVVENLHFLQGVPKAPDVTPPADAVVQPSQEEKPQSFVPF